MATGITFTVEEFLRELRRWMGGDTVAIYITALRAGDNQTTVEFLQGQIRELPNCATSVPPSEDELARKVAMVETHGSDYISTRARYIRWRQMIDFLSQSAVAPAEQK